MSGGTSFSEGGGQRALIGLSGLIVGARIGGAVFGLAIQVLLAKLMSAEAIGVFFVATGGAAVLAIICTLGYPMLMPRMAAEADGGADGALLVRFVRRARIDAAVLSVIALMLLLGAGILLPGLSTGARTSLVFIALTLPAYAFTRVNGSLANGLRRFGLGFLPELFMRPGLLLVFVVAFWLAFETMSVQVVLMANILIASMLVVWQERQLRDVRGDRAGGKGNTAASQAGEAAAWRRRSLPLVIAALFIGVFADLDIIIARVFMNDAQVGVFGVCLKISLLVGFAIQAVHQLILRDTADALSSGDADGLGQVIGRANRLTIAGSVAATIIVLVFGETVLRFFGDEFVPGYWCLLILMLAQVGRAVAGPATHVLTLAGREKACLPVFAASLVALVAVNAGLVPFFGINGAAVAVLAVTLLWTAWMAAVARRVLEVNTVRV